MTRIELLTGDIVLSTKGSYGIVLLGTCKGDLIKWFRNKDGRSINRFRSLGMIDENLKFKFDGDNRIIKVYRITEEHDLAKLEIPSDKYLIWEEMVKEVTISDLEELYGCKVKIVGES